jgi:dipeptidyl aminopeptidase/acylaminoacyl peptidase
MHPEDLYRLPLVSDAQSAPDDRHVAFVRTELDEAGNTYRSHIWLAPAGGGVPRPLTRGDVQDASPRWSPDGSAIAFLRAGQLWLLRLDGGEPRPLANASGAAVWSPDGQAIAFVGKEDLPAEGAELFGFAPPAGVRVVTRTHYKLDGVGLLPNKRSRVYVVPVEGGTPEPVSAAGLDCSSPAWAPDGRRLAYVAAHSGETRPAELLVDGQVIASLTAIAAPAWSPDGSSIAFIGHNKPGWNNGPHHSIWLVRPGEAPRDLCPGFDRSVGGHNRSYERANPPADQLTWSADGKALYFIATDGGEQPVWALCPESGEVRRAVPCQRQVFASFSVSPGGKLAAIVDDDGSAGEVALFDMATQEGDLLPHQVGGRPQGWVGRPERILFEGHEGWPVEGWVLAPKGLEPGRKYPLVLNIHGGPHGAWGNTLMAENQVLAEAGFGVLYVNPRGSQGYGHKHTEGVVGKWGQGDYGDLMAAVDYAIAAYDWIDPERLGVMGNSYGGFMTNWIISHTHRFKAAVSQGTVFNRISSFGTADFGHMRGEMGAAAYPWSHSEVLWRESPGACIGNARTPTLVLHGTDDQRCPLEQGEQLYAALRVQGVDAVLVRYPGESHGFTRTGRPAHRVDRLKRIAAWFRHYLG